MSLDNWLDYLKRLIIPATFSTIKVVLIVVIIGFFLGFIVGSLLYIYSPSGLKPNKTKYRFLSFFVNVVRSIPILILIVAVFPLTRLITGTTMGPTAIILPLSLAATAFISRYLENTFHSVDSQLIEAVRSYGASNLEIMRYIVVTESIPSMISVFTIALVNNIAASTIAGAVGGGGIGSIAINYGYQSFNNTILYTSVFVLYLLVQAVQTVGNAIYNHKIKN